MLIQYFFWFNPVLIVAAGLFLSAGWALKRLAGRSGIGRFPPFFFTVLLLVMGGREFGLFRWVAHLTDADPPRGRAIRLVHWNMSVFEAAPGVDVGQNLAAAGMPDILLVSMQNNPRLWEQIHNAMKPTPQTQVTMLNIGIDKVFSRFPVTSTRCFTIPFSGENVPEVPTVPPLLRRSLRWFFRSMQLHNRSVDEIEDATIIGVTFDTVAEYGRPTHAWFIDMPSNPLAGRADLARRVAAKAAELVKDGSLPTPDFIAGDFNIPLGSHSLSLYAPGFTPASGTAGLGRLASWPRHRAVLQLDHILVAPTWRVSDYQLLDPGASEHMAQTALLWPADTSPASGAPK